MLIIIDALICVLNEILMLISLIFLLMRSLFDEIWELLFLIFFFLLAFSHFFFERFIWAFEKLIWELRGSALWLVFIFSHLNVKSVSMRGGVILLFSDPSGELVFVFWVFDSNVLFVPGAVVEISSIFVSEVSVIFFIRFFGCIDFIVYIFEVIMTFSLFVELISTKIIRDVLSEYKIWEFYLFAIVFKATFLIRSQLRLKALY